MWSLRIPFPEIFISIVLFFITNIDVNGQDSRRQRLTSVEEVCNLYPDRMRKMLGAIDIDIPEIPKDTRSLEGEHLVKACDALLRYYRTAMSRAWIIPEAPSSGSEIIEAADAICEDRFTFYDQTAMIPRKSDGTLDWTFRGPTDDQEWAWGLNRHSHINILLNAFLITEKDKYVRQIDAHLQDWVISSIPYPAKKSSTAMWRGLEVSFRVKQWAKVFYTLMEHPSLTPATQLLILTSLPEHAHYLRNYHGQTNWMTMELSALAMLSAAWPEFTAAESWIAYAQSKLEEEVKSQVYPDGVQTELTSHYHWVALRNFIEFADICEAVGVSLAQGFHQRLEGMWNYLAYAMRPSGYGPLNNDSNLDYNRDRVLDAAQKYQRGDWTYVASNGSEGSIPDGTPSYVFPWAGQVIMRSGYDQNAHWAFFDVGPWGTGHQHDDKLHLSIHAGGRDLLVDAGRFAYRGEVAKFRKAYAVQSLGHNVILIDGKGQNPGPKLVKTPLEEGSFTSEESFDYALGSMSNFESISGEVTHRRAILYVRGFAWIVVDRIESDRPREITALWHWHPSCTVTIDGADTYSIDPGQGNLGIFPVGENNWANDLVKGQKSPQYQGWYSEKYNTYEPNSTSVYHTTVQENATIIWCLIPGMGNVEKGIFKIIEQDDSKVKLTINNLQGKNYELVIPWTLSIHPSVNIYD